MSRETDELIKGHEYDGIQEFNNPLPGWWLLTFYATIIFAFVYWIHYEFGGGLTPAQELAVQMEQIQGLKKDGPSFSEEALAALATEDRIKNGKEVYVAKCAACHGPGGEGLIGPNLTDKHWIHGDGSRVTIAQLLVTGVADKGMPPWQGVISDDELKNVANYVFSIKGTFAAGGKPAQGTEY